MDINVAAVDVNGVPVRLKKVDASYGRSAPGSTDAITVTAPIPELEGSWPESSPFWMVRCVGGGVKITAIPSSQQLAPATVTVNAADDPRAWNWDNPAVEVKASYALPSKVTLTIQRATIAPIAENLAQKVEYLDSQLLGMPCTQPGAIKDLTLNGYLSEPATDEPADRWTGDRRPRHLTAPAYPRKDPDQPFLATEDPLIGTASATGWARFNTQPQPADPLGKGRFLLVEYGDADAAAFAEGRRYLVAVWSPAPLGHPLLQPDTLDVIVHYSPSTLKPEFTRVTYPYGAAVDQGRGPAVGRGRVLQPYIFLAERHLLTSPRLELAFSLLAAGRKAAIVMPISPAGAWGPFRVAAGLWRFLLELPGLLATNGYPHPAFAQHQPPASLGQVVLTGFSEGGPVAAGLLPGGPVISDPPQSKFRWGSRECPLAQWSSPTADHDFADHLAEFWDIDSSFQGAPRNAFTTQRAAMARFVATGSDKRLRMYHTVGTVGQWRPSRTSEQASEFGKLLQTMQDPKEGKSSTNDWAQQWDDGASPSRWTVLLFSDSPVTDAWWSNDGYVGGPNGINSGPNGIDPNPAGGHYLAGHELMPRIAFGHAATLSQLAAW